LTLSRSWCDGFVRCIFLAGLSVMACAGCASPRPQAAPQGPVVYPPKPSEPRVVALGTISGSMTQKTDRSALRRFVTGEAGDEPGIGLVRPLSVAVRGGEVLVCDAGLEAVVRINPIDSTIRPLLRRGSPQPVRPVALAVNGAGDVFIADAGGGEVWRADASGAVLTRYRPDVPKPKFEPIGVAASSDRVYAVNRVLRSVEVFELESGRYLGRLGAPTSTSSADDDPVFPAAVSVDAGGRVFVVDVLGCRLKVYAADGQLVSQIGSPGDRPGQFARPRSVAVGPDGTIHVSDAATQVVQVFNPAGEPLMSYGGSDAGAGSMTLPAGLCTDSSLIDLFRARMPEGFEPSYLILVANQLGPGRIGVYAFGEFPGAGFDRGVQSPAGVGR
jgi:DNA-binding beta-propeller fold protein YncE